MAGRSYPYRPPGRYDSPAVLLMRNRRAEKERYGFKNMKENALKALIATTLAGIGAYFHLLLAPLVVLVLVMLGDYVTGLLKAWLSRSVSSRTGIIGIVKKLAYLAAVAVGITVDWIVASALTSTGLTLSNGFCAFGLLVTVWLVLNELISILENLSGIGVPLPKFLTAAVARLSKTLENSVPEQRDAD